MGIFLDEGMNVLDAVKQTQKRLQGTWVRFFLIPTIRLIVLF